MLMARHISYCTTVIAGWLFLLCVETCTAAAPKVDILFPPGGTRGETVTVTLTGTFDPWPVQIWCNRPELTFKALEEKGKIEITIPAGVAPGTAWIRAYNSEGSAELRPFLIGTLPSIEEIEPNNEISKLQVLAESKITVYGKHQAADDVDIFAVNLKGGSTLVVDLEAHRNLGSPSDPVLQILDSRGFVLQQNDDDIDLDPRLIFSPATDGQYLIRTFAFPAQTDSSIRFAGGANWLYRLTMTTGPFVDHTLPLTTTRGASVEVRSQGWNLSPVPLKSVVPATVEERLEFTALEDANTLIIPAYSLATAIEVEPNNGGQPQLISVPVGISGEISVPGDSDVFRFSAKKGLPLNFQVLGRELGARIDPVVSISDGQGKQLQRFDDKGDRRDPEFTWNPPVDGDFLMTVSDVHGHGGERYHYHINIAPPQPEVRLTVSEGKFVLPADKPLEIPVNIERRAGFKGDLDITISGLPEWITVIPAKSLNEGDSSKSVKLTLTGMGLPFSGPIQILATTSSEPKTSQTARFSQKEYFTEAESIWLTSLGK